MAALFQCSVVTPERSVLDCEARFVAFPAHDGEMGILRNRAPLLCRLGIGRLRVEAEGETYAFAIDGGFAQMVENRLTILTEQAESAADVDREAARHLLEEAMARRATSEREHDDRRRDIKWARSRLDLAK